MREIKFRYWNKDEGIMIDGDSLAFEQYEPLKDLLTQEGIMQFTGLHDKNGKEIWESDIVRYDARSYGGFNTAWVEVIARICMKYGGWCCETMKKSSNRMFNELSGSDLKHVEVIGNIYEHPELLEGK